MNRRVLSRPCRKHVIVLSLVPDPEDFGSLRSSTRPSYPDYSGWHPLFETHNYGVR